MNRFLAFVTLSVVASSAMALPAARKQAQPTSPTSVLPVFEFKGMTAGEPLDMAQFSGCEKSDNELSCNGRDDTVAGIQTYISPTYYVYNGKLSSMFLLFPEGNFVTLLSALTQKYGKPCKSEIEKWQNKAGSTFDNPTLTWCFKTGKLDLHELSIQRDYSDIQYHDTANVAPATPAKVDF